MSRWHKTEFDMLPERAFQPRAGGGMTLEGGGGGSSAMDQMSIMTAMSQAKLSAEQLAWAKELYAAEAPARDYATDLANQVSAAQLAQSQSQTRMAEEAYQDYKTNYQPLEQQLIQDARSYDTEDRREAEAGRAMADVSQQFTAAGEAAIRDMQRSGVNPSDGKMLGARQALVAQEALARTAAANTARRQVETVGAAKMADAANLGRGIASSQATNASLALQQGNSAVGNASAALAAGQSGAGLVQGAYGTAIQGMGAAGNAFGNISAAQGAASAQKGANTAAGVGAVASVAAIAI
ncbi:hypothetical protein [Xenophilus sp. Marseille-Q4582]|uniref:hypothetical protein n=1 Tax=Xenophilus sp. Marseille-Q4582 TaxID=2866600 RepID=UPI001CE3BE2C|nr:hypothetical protein [Xenophilus sp. Marseille-Q4582]